MKNILFLSRWMLLFASFYFLTCCSSNPQEKTNVEKRADLLDGIELMVLGTVQDAGSPHIGCKKSCCADISPEERNRRKVVSLGILDYQNDAAYLFEATPDITDQINFINAELDRVASAMPEGIFVSHAHIGHYSGLMYLGKEAKNAKKVPVYCKPRMTNFLSNNGPWDQLVNNENIILHSLEKEIELSANLEVDAIPVPHRDEYSETVGFHIKGKNKEVLFIPDIDKWHKWDESIVEWIKKVDFAFVDATFYNGAEINYRDISQIPHPFVVESMELFDGLSDEDKRKIFFIHLNHTNALLDVNSEAYKKVISSGYNVAEIGTKFQL